MRCIECEEIELARVRDARADQKLPIPFAALDGFPTGRSPADLTRRRLLQWGVAGLASVYAAKELGWDQVWEAVAAANETSNKCLVLLYLAGGNDGLNVVLPADGADYDAYVTARSALHRGQGVSTADRVGSWAMGGGSPLAFANVAVSKNGGGDNSLAKWNFLAGGDDYGFDTLYQAGKLAVMPAVDAKKYTLSHFDNSDIWFEASYDLTTKAGWLGRWIDKNGDPNNPLQAISIDTALSKSIRTLSKPVSAVSSLPMNGFNLAGNAPPSGSPSTYNGNTLVNGLAGVAASAGNTYLKRSRDTYGLAYQTYLKLQPLTATPTATATPTPVPPVYPNNSTLSNKLKTAAILLGANLGTRVITIHWGGFDTHTNQLNTQDKQLAELSRALGAFQADLVQRGIDDRVATLVFSEFGRRVKETPNTTATSNDAGTDHGAGGLMLAMGTKVRGGFAADWPGCRPEDLVPANNPAQGNLQVPTDYRSVYRAVLAEWLGDDDPDAVIGGGTIDPLHRGDGQTGLFLPTS